MRASPLRGSSLIENNGSRDGPSTSSYYVGFADRAHEIARSPRRKQIASTQRSRALWS
jgi:hypothetical protein